MFFDKILVACVLMAIIVVVYFCRQYQSRKNDDYLYGMWMADNDDFCAAGDITAMMLYIGSAAGNFCGSTVARPCYLIVMDDIYSGGFDLTYTRGWSGLCGSKYQIQAHVGGVDDLPPLWPEQVTVAIDTQKGTLTVRDDTTVYAKLTKQHDVSNLTRY